MIGIDLVQVERIRRLYERYGERFLERIFTERELAYAMARKRRFESLAGMFALKEAFMKAKGGRISFTEIEILHGEGRPYILFEGTVFERVSISHEGGIAAGVVCLGGG